MKKKLTLLLLFLFSCYFVLNGAPLLDRGALDYLSSARTLVTFSDGGGRDQLLAGIPSDKKVYLSGETHALTESYEAKKYMITTLYEKRDMRILLCEDGFCSGLLLNDYIHSGNTSLLQQYMKQLDGTLACTNDEYDFWHWLFTFNQSLPSGEQIQIFGLDVDFQQDTALLGLSLLANGRTPDTSIASAIDALKVADSSAPSALQSALTKHPKEMASYFGDSLPLIKQGLHNLDATAAYYAGSYGDDLNASEDFRDSTMMDNFLLVYSLYPDAVFFGQFGSEHIYQKACRLRYSGTSVTRFGMRLCDQDSPVCGKVFSMLYLYLEDGEEAADGFFCSQLFENTVSSIYAYPLTQKGSPFLTRELLLNNNGTGGASTDYIQSVLVIPNPHESAPYLP